MGKSSKSSKFGSNGQSLVPILEFDARKNVFETKIACRNNLAPLVFSCTAALAMLEEIVSFVFPEVLPQQQPPTTSSKSPQGSIVDVVEVPDETKRRSEQEAIASIYNTNVVTALPPRDLKVHERYELISRHCTRLLETVAELRSRGFLQKARYSEQWEKLDSVCQLLQLCAKPFASWDLLAIAETQIVKSALAAATEFSCVPVPGAKKQQQSCLKVTASSLALNAARLAPLHQLHTDYMRSTCNVSNSIELAEELRKNSFAAHFVALDDPSASLTKKQQVAGHLEFVVSVHDLFARMKTSEVNASALKDLFAYAKLHMYEGGESEPRTLQQFEQVLRERNATLHEKRQQKLAQQKQQEQQEQKVDEPNVLDEIFSTKISVIDEEDVEDDDDGVEENQPKSKRRKEGCAPHNKSSGSKNCSQDEAKKHVSPKLSSRSKQRAKMAVLKKS